jgi:hypothetical protein
MADQPLLCRPIQFRLRTLFVVVTVVAAASWFVADRQRLFHERNEARHEAQRLDRYLKFVQKEYEADQRQTALKLDETMKLMKSDQSTIKSLEKQLRDLQSKETN